MDVEGILNQIRERVVSEPAVRPHETRLSTSVHSNGSPAVTDRDDALQRLRTHLAIAGRAADRLPPVFSNRQGTRARLELWFKKKTKPLTRWFTWEQVNFNRAVNDALGDVVEILKRDAQELAAWRGQLRAEAADLKTQVGQTTNNYARLKTDHANLAAAYQALLAEHTKLSDQVIDLAAQLRDEDRKNKMAQDEEFNRRLSQLAEDLKEEQRVCFRQISLETGESAVLEDRARRALLARIEKLEETLKTGRR
jgi:hypothetical protein